MATPYLLSPSYLRELIVSGVDVSILDVTWFMPNTRPPRDPSQEFLAKHIPCAWYLDLDEVASPHPLGLKHMMPSAQVFAEACETFGIHPNSHVVIYDTHGVFSSPRALFMFRAFGHQKSSILDGGLPRWEAEGFETTGGPPTGQRSVYPAPVSDKAAIRSYEQVIANSLVNPASDPAVELVVDARVLRRFLGLDPEPRPSLPSGHIPHAFSLTFSLFLQKHAISNSPGRYTTFLSEPDLREALVNAIGAHHAQSVLDGKRLIFTTCGSGMTAAILWLGLKILGVPRVALYDEAWAGYARRPQSRFCHHAFCRI